MVNETAPIRLVVMSGLSGAGKTIALRTLEDMDYYCVDNLPAALMPSLVQAVSIGGHRRIGVGVDVRNRAEDLNRLPDVLADLGLQVPKTTSQFLAACRTAKAKGKYFLNLAGASAQNASLFATVVATSHVLAKDPGWNLKRITGKTTFAGTPQWRTTLQTIVDMKNAGCFPPGAEANDNIHAAPFVQAA